LMASERMVTVGTLAAGVAHEINNPMAAVTANLDFALREVRSAGVAELAEVEVSLRESREAVDRVRQILRDLKVFSRQDERREVIDLRGVIESTLRVAYNEIKHRARIVTELDARSRPGKGSTFRISLPAAADTVTEAEAKPAPKAPPARRGRVLVIDDEAAIGAGLRRLLSSEHDVVALTSPREALDRLLAG